MKINNIKTLIAVLSLAFVGVSCDHDESVPRAPKAVVELIEDNVTVSESGTYPNLTFKQDIPTVPQVDDQYTSWHEFAGSQYAPGERGVEMRIEIVGGTAEEGVDFVWTPTVPVSWVGGTTVNDVGFGYWGGDGLYYWLSPDATALSHTVSLNSIITVLNDGNSEGSETIEFRFYPAGMGLATIDDTLTVTITD